MVCFFALSVACGGSSNGGGQNQCTSGATCTPASGAAVCQTYATVCTGNVSSCAATAQTDGTACGSGNVCSAGACVAACVPSQSCTPAQADPCHSFQTACDSTLTKTSCVAAAALVDGTECGNLQACSAGSCVASSTRLVSSTLQTAHVRADGTAEERPGWDVNVTFGAQVVALVVPDTSDPTGYKIFPVTVGADSHFSVPDVPFGPYFIEVDVPSSRLGGPAQQVFVVERVLYEVSTSFPDLTMVGAQRPDLTFDFSGQPPSVQFNVVGLAPVAAGDGLRMFSSDDELNVSLSPITSRSLFTPPVAVGATTLNASTSWARAAGVDPNAAAGDLTWIWQRRTVPAVAGATLLNSLTFARISDFTVDPASGGTLTAAMSAVPQTGGLPSVNWSQFAALANGIHPGATPSSDTAPFIGMEAVPSSVAFPDEPLGTLPRQPLHVEPQVGASQTDLPQTFAAEATLGAPLGIATDADYSSVASGQFFDAGWQRAVQVFYSFDVPLATSGGQTIVLDGGLYRAFDPEGTLTQPVAPIISAPTSPQIGGNDAFAFQASVGTQPRITWSPPAIGTATSYIVSFGPFRAFQQDGEVALLTAVLFDRTDFVPPAGFLQAGTSYYGQITAVNSPARLDSRVLGIGGPVAQTSLLFGLFTP
ncbi:MAG TPA: hypothetical protein VGH20_11785 [Myxococcales bacterium]